MHARLSEIATVPAGWLDGKGNAVTDPAMATAHRLADVLPRTDIIAYQCEEGGVIFEFIRDGWDFSVEVHPSGAATVYGIEVGGRSFIEETDLTAEIEDLFSQGLFGVAGRMLRRGR